ncbi:MAG: alpha/beta hydrolase [Candidatus Parcubacteria bacterium]|nr:alpha/beta hydrolase [Candidatus Parcubacteria bacterium]
MKLPILILHGWGSSPEKWDRVKENMESRGFEVYIPCLPGFGTSPPPQKPWSVDDYTDWVASFCEKKKLSQFFLLGHSFGGRIAVKLTVRNSGKIAGLILCGAPAIRDESAVKETTMQTSSMFAKKFSSFPAYPFFRKLFYKYILRKTDYVNLGGSMKETFQKVVKEDLSEYLPQIRVKTLVLWGENDKLVPLETAYMIKNRILGSELFIFPNIGHSPHLEIPGDFSEAVADFIKKVIK